MTTKDQGFQRHHVLPCIETMEDAPTLDKLLPPCDNVSLKQSHSFLTTAVGRDVPCDPTTHARFSERGYTRTSFGHGYEDSAGGFVVPRLLALLACAALF